MKVTKKLIAQIESAQKAGYSAINISKGAGAHSLAYGLQVSINDFLENCQDWIGRDWSFGRSFTERGTRTVMIDNGTVIGLSLLRKKF